MRMSKAGVARSERHSFAALASAEQAWEVLTGFIADGIERQDQVLVAGLRDDQVRHLLQRLREEGGVHPDAAMTDGQIVMMDDTTSRAFLRLRTEEVAAQLTELVRQAVQDGYRGVRLTGLLGENGVGPHEAVLNDLVGELPLSVLCPYFATDLTRQEVEQVRALHGHEVADAAVYDDGSLRITRPRRGWVRLAGRWDAGNHAAAIGVVALAAAAGDRDLDVASLRSIDQAGMSALLTKIGGGLRLRRPTDDVQRIAAQLADPSRRGSVG